MPLIRRLLDAWVRFWFAAGEPPLALEAVRIGVGAALLLSYGFLGGDIHALYGPDGWTPAAAVRADLGAWAIWSPLFHVDAAWQLTAFYAAWLIATLAFTLGLFTGVTRWLVLLGHLAIVHRHPVAQYGVDSVASCLLVVLCVAPLGRAWSLDARWRGKRLAPSPRGTACLRLIQLQMVVFFFFAGVSKLKGDAWWEGYAVWIALLNDEFAAFPVGLFARHFWLVNLFTYGAVLIEIAYPFLVWGRARVAMVAGAVALHLGIALLMGLWAFSLIMAAGHLAFLRADELRALARWRPRRAAAAG